MSTISPSDATNGSHQVRDQAGKVLGSVERTYRGGGASWQFVPLIDGRPVDEPHRTLRSAAALVARVAGGTQ